MTEIKWFKLDSHIFDSAEMRYLGKLNERGAAYQLIWIKLLCEAAKRGDGGRIYVYKDSYVTPRQLSMLVDMNEDVLTDALSLFDALGMVKYDDISGLVIRNFSDYVGYGFASDEYDRDAEYEEAEAPEISEEEKKRERNREAQRRWRERQKIRKAEATEADSATDLSAEDKIIRSNYERNNRNNGVTESNNSVITRNENRNNSVITRNMERNESNDYTVISSPKNIFIEENRIDKNRIDESRTEDKRKEQITKEENENNYLSRSLSDNAYGDFGIDDGDGSGYLTHKGASHTLASPPPAHAEEKERDTVKRSYGIFENVYLTDGELRELEARFGGALPSLIEDLSTGMESEGKSYSNHYATLLRWGKNKYAPRVKPSCESGEPLASFGQGAGDNRADSFAARGCGGSVRRECGDDGEENSPRDAPNWRGGGFGAQKKDSYRGGYESVRHLTKEEAEEAFRLALERSEKDFASDE